MIEELAEEIEKAMHAEFIFISYKPPRQGKGSIYDI